MNDAYSVILNCQLSKLTPSTDDDDINLSLMGKAKDFSPYSQAHSTDRKARLMTRRSRLRQINFAIQVRVLQIEHAGAGAT